MPKTITIIPLEFERLEPVKYTPEQEAALARQIADAHARGAFRQPEPVFLLCTLAGASP